MNLWIEWDPTSGEKPPKKGDYARHDYVTIRRRDGFVFAKRLSMVDWTHTDMPSDVVAYCFDYVPEKPSPTEALEKLNTRLDQIGGCGDGDCKVIVRPGMHTNGGCRCLTDSFRAGQVVQAYRTYVRETT